VTDHPFEDTPQYEGIYGNKHGPPIGRPGNGLGWCPRKSGDEGLIHDPEIDDEAPESDGEPTIWERRGITPEQLIEAAQGLTARQMFVIRLLYGLDEVSPTDHHEIADLLGITVEGVYNLERRALAVLAKLVTVGE
jgi:DNA-directed RNA polymerase specialized sigma subunit